MSSLNNTQGNLKKVMRTTLVGIKPADQVMLKGYLRVLLRLEVDLEWVAASHPEIDLYIINDEFKRSDSIKKLLNNQKQNAVLYVSHTDQEEGWMSQNKIVLPLKKLHELNQWLISNVDILNNKAQKRQNVPEADLTIKNSQNNQTNQHNPNTQINQNTHTQTQRATQSHSEPAANSPQKSLPDERYQTLIRLIRQLQTRPEGLYELTDNHTPFATVYPKKSLVWLHHPDQPTALSLNWSIRPRQGQMPAVQEARDMNQWLWEVGFNHSQDLIALLSDSTSYQLRYWIKPKTGQQRRELLRLMTALEKKAQTLNQLAQKTNLSLDTTKKIVASLLFAGNLQPQAYQELKVTLNSLNTQNTQQTTTQTSSPNPQPQPTEQAPKRLTVESVLARRASGQTSPNPPEQKPAEPEKMGFLARLRRKLGL